MFDHPFMALVLLSAVMLALVHGIDALEKGASVHAWMSRHRVGFELLKGILIVLAVPGLLIIRVWVPGMKAEDLTEPTPRWFAYLIGALVAASLLYGAARIFLAGR